MTCDTLQSSLLEQLPRELDYSLAPQPGLLVCDPPTPYRPRHPEETAPYQLFENHFDSYVRAYEERFEPQHGPLRAVVVRSVEQFRACGRLEGGFTRFRCPRRSYGAYSNRSRVTARVTQDFAGLTAQPSRADEDSEFTKDARRTWARLLAKSFELDPMLCSCGAEMKIVSVITDARVVDRILRHLESERCKARDPFEPRAPPRRAALSQFLRSHNQIA